MSSPRCTVLSTHPTSNISTNSRLNIPAHINRFYHKNGETFDCKDLTRLSTPTVSPGPPTASDCPAGSTWSGVLLRPGSERANLLGTVRWHRALRAGRHLCSRREDNLHPGLHSRRSGSWCLLLGGWSDHSLHHKKQPGATGRFGEVPASWGHRAGSPTGETNNLPHQEALSLVQSFRGVLRSYWSWELLQIIPHLQLHTNNIYDSHYLHSIVYIIKHTIGYILFCPVKILYRHSW